MIKRAWVNIGMMEKMLTDLIENCPCCGKNCKMAMLKQKKGNKGLREYWKNGKDVYRFG